MIFLKINFLNNNADFVRVSIPKMQFFPSLSLAKGKLDEKNEWKIFTAKIAEKASFSQLPYLEYDFMIANKVRLNLAVLKISETSQEHNSGGVLC